MRMKSLTKYLGAVALFAAVTVHAQTPASPPPDPAASGSASASVTTSLSIPQMSERLVALDAQIVDDAREMHRLQDVARKEKDVVKLTCVNDRLVELKAQRNIFDQSNQSFQALIAAGNTEAVRPSFDELVAAAADIKELRNAAEACIGVPELYKQESDVQVTHPDFPDDPTTTDPFDDPVFEQVEPPGYASPFA